MFGALNAHYRREEERRVAQMQQQRLAQQQRAAAAAAAQTAAAKNKLQPAYGQYQSRTPDPARRLGEQQAYRSQSTIVPPMQNGNVGRVMRVEQQLKPSRSDGSFPCSSSEEESDDEAVPPTTKPKARKSIDEWKAASIKTKSVSQLSQPRKKTYN